MWCVLDGQLLPVSEARIDPRDRGWALADGCFETIRVVKGQPLWLGWHWERLTSGLDTLNIPYPSPDTMGDDIVRLVVQTGIIDGIARVQVTRGVQHGRPWPPPLEAIPTLLITLLPAPQLPAMPITLRVIIAQTTRRNEWSPLSRFKSLGSYPDQIMAAREAQQRHADDALLLNTAGQLACGTIGNLWVVRGDTLITPPLAAGALAGTVRRWIFETLPRLNFTVVEQSILPEDVFHADECWLTNVGRGIQLITAVDGQPLIHDNRVALEAYRRLLPILKGDIGG